jgi:molybdopterin/thiamine biosynthesis adenylyltransferase
VLLSVSFCAAKNLILSGVKTVGLHDDEPVTAADLSSQVFPSSHFVRPIALFVSKKFLSGIKNSKTFGNQRMSRSPAF